MKNRMKTSGRFPSLNLSRTGKFKVWQNPKGDWCIGNKCFRMRAADDGVHIAFNPNGKNCPTNLNEALSKITELAKQGKPTNYKIPRPVEEDW
jgi:hypothetical protein